MTTPSHCFTAKAQRAQSIAPSRLNHRGTEDTEASHTEASHRRTVASTKTQRRQGVTKTSQRTDPEMQNQPTGAGRLWCARLARKGTVEGRQTAAASCGRDARTTMVLPLHVTLSEGVRRPSRRVPRGSVGRSSPARNAIDRSGLPNRRGCFDSLRSLSMTRFWRRPRTKSVSIREIRVQFAMCDVLCAPLCFSVPLWFNCDALRPLRVCGSTLRWVA